MEEKIEDIRMFLCDCSHVGTMMWKDSYVRNLRKQLFEAKERERVLLKGMSDSTKVRDERAKYAILQKAIKKANKEA